MKEKLYTINDNLTSLADELGVEWSGDNQKDIVLDNLTYAVAQAFGIEY